MSHHHIPAAEKCEECRMLAAQGFDLARFSSVQHYLGYSSMSPKPRTDAPAVRSYRR